MGAPHVAGGVCGLVSFLVAPGHMLSTIMAQLDSALPEATASMQRDVMAGRPSELDAQIGAVVRLGQEVTAWFSFGTCDWRALLCRWA